jgi:hypothetical protein
MRRSLLASPLLLCLALSGAVAGSATTAVTLRSASPAAALAVPPTVPSLTAEQERVLLISDAAEAVAANPAAPDGTHPAVTPAAALAIAAAYLGRTGDPARILYGRAPRTSGDPVRQAWVVLFAGGVAPVDGPPGYDGPPPTFSLTGVIVDDQTGEVLRMFMC